MSSFNLTPLSPEQQQLAQQLAGSTNRDQALWLSGFFAGIGSAGSGAALPAPASASLPLTVLYGSESGNAEKLAGDIKKRADKAGFKARIANMGDAKPADLAKAENLLVIVSTWGEGDPPDGL